ncbi:acetyltransferase, ribosomal protein N-acetylase [Aciduliprofundum sp. MAR08-339]|uniref:GNAT family N-acetyltransferase n=1 Tax=Aciduliprofundum sp. (strain MAR08-339) TaxID=673860 RepID=UPI0002A4A83E|nr:acetyltransferase, ribosomal protein N-acetylase [Aciduliprofundum sp. MAR08-339]
MIQLGPIIMRAWERKDLEYVHRWENDFETMLYSRGTPHHAKGLEQIERYFEEEIKRDDRLHYIVLLRESMEPIGTAVIRLQNWGNVPRGNIGTYLDRQYWNRGLGKIITLSLLEICFYHKNLEKCEACSIEYNKRAHRVLESCGFKLYGKSRKAAFVLGRKWDWYCFDILREEYMEEREKLIMKVLGDEGKEYLKYLNDII